MQTTTLYRPVSKGELDLIMASGYKAFPPRLPEQPIFYPVTNLEYARQITVEWNLPFYGNGYVTQFEVESAYLSQFKVETVGGEMHTELWVPAEELANFNQHIVGKILVVESYEREK
ncbi:MAG: hypothetical protein ACKVTZ_01855 [Bacteroidia bacterium]